MFFLKKDDGTYFTLRRIGGIGPVWETMDKEIATKFLSQTEATHWLEKHCVYMIPLKEMGYKLEPVGV